MTFFTTFTHPLYPHKIILVPEKFSFWVLIFGGIGLLFQKSWVSGLLACGVSILINSFVQDWMLKTYILIGFQFVLACFARSLQRLELRLSGWKEGSIVAERSYQYALLRLLDNNSDLRKKFY